jgi:hypothetical protein
MRQPNPKHEVLLKLSAIINSKENLWKEIANLIITDKYFLLHEDFYGKVMMQVVVLEQHLGETEETSELKSLISSLTRPAVQQATNSAKVNE